MGLGVALCVSLNVLVVCGCIVVLALGGYYQRQCNVAESVDCRVILAAASNIDFNFDYEYEYEWVSPKCRVKGAVAPYLRGFHLIAGEANNTVHKCKEVRVNGRRKLFRPEADMSLLNDPKHQNYRKISECDWAGTLVFIGLVVGTPAVYGVYLWWLVIEKNDWDIYKNYPFEFSK